MSAPDVTVAATPVRTARVYDVVQHVRLYEQVRDLTRERFDATLAHASARAQYNAAVFDAQAQHVAARAEFVAAMTKVYRDPIDAVRRFETDAATRTARAAVETLTATPESYGAVRTTDRPGMAGFFRRADETPARMAAHDAAIRALTVEHRRVEMIEVPRATAALRETQYRVETVAARLDPLPTTTRIERDIRATLRDLTPDDHRTIATHLTEAQRAVMQMMTAQVRETVREAVRDIALGRDGRER